MPQAFVRRGVWALGTAAAVFLLAVAALPMVASTQIVRDRIAYELSAWSGYRVEFGGTPEIDIWPSFRAVLSDVKFSDWQDTEHRPVIETERIEVGLSALAALGGDAVLSDARLLRPILHVTPAGGLLYAPNLPAGGRITGSIAAAREALALNPTSPDLSGLPDDAFGSVEFVDGQVVVSRGTTDEPVMTSLAGTIRWPALNRGAVLSATAIWRGESFTLDATLGQPLMLFAGGSSPLTVALKAAPVTFSFDGTASLADNAFVDGTTSLSAPSLRRMLEWWANDVVTSSATVSFSLAGRAIGDARRIKVENAEVRLDGDPGTGLLDFKLGDEAPAVNGTLAFDELDLAAFLYAFTPLSPGTATTPMRIDPATAGRLGFDLRLSAARAAIGTLTLSDLAATLQARNGMTAFDISDATVFGGSLQAGVRYQAGEGKDQVEMSFLGTDLDAAALAQAAGTGALAPTGRVGLSTMLKGKGQTLDAFLETAQGTVSASFGPGRIAGFDLQAFLGRVQEGGFFALGDVGGGSLAIERADLKATLGAGLARLEKAEFVTSERTMRLAGIVPHVGRGLALTGAVLPRATDGAAEPEPLTRFFVGGSWSAPFVSPAFTPPEP
ncbi:MAG: AsmA family protein [Rhizobiaceae bacterium]|nr:AsmA family protein [Rhizobiaceae bacterium]